MYENQHPLRYRISSWLQLSKCKSNLSRELSLSATQLVNNDILTGTLIQIHHSTYGVIFACVLSAKGNMVQPNSNGVVDELTPDVILAELYKYGFDIQYVPAKGLPGSQVAYLMTLDNLKFDKIRLINVYKYVNGQKAYRLNVVAFIASALGDWLNSGYCPSESEFNQALGDGTAINLSGVSKTQNYNWDWLSGWVANISDIISDCAEAQQ